jgi:hypothetical protein
MGENGKSEGCGNAATQALYFSRQLMDRKSEFILYHNLEAAITVTANDCLDIGSDLGSPVSLDYFDQAPFAFNGKIVTTRISYPKNRRPMAGAATPLGALIATILKPG